MTVVFKLMWLAGCLWLLPAAMTQAAAITDDRGVAVTFPQPPRRVVSLLPSLTETVCALGHCSALVGVDRHSNYPEGVKKLPQLGGGMEPNIEAIVALRPDVVLLATSSRAALRLESLGLRVIALEPKTHADVRRSLETIEALFADGSHAVQRLPVPGATAAALWAEIDRGLSEAADRLSPQARAASVYIEVGRGPYAAGAASFIGETLARLGPKNIVPRSLGPFPLINPEYVVRANPTVILFTSSSVAATGLYPGWAAMPAVRAQRICRFDAAQGDVLVRPGPRMAQAAQLLAGCLERALR